MTFPVRLRFLEFTSVLLTVRVDFLPLTLDLIHTDGPSVHNSVGPGKDSLTMHFPLNVLAFVLFPIIILLLTLPLRQIVVKIANIDRSIWPRQLPGQSSKFVGLVTGHHGVKKQGHPYIFDVAKGVESR